MQFTHGGVSLIHLGIGAACSTGRPTWPFRSTLEARKQFQWKPIAGYQNAGTGDQRVHLKIA
jgi:hypothetical protein